MLKLLKHLINGNELLTSQLYNEITFYRAFCQDLRKAQRSVVIESPYLTENRVRYFLPLFDRLVKRKVKIRINTRHPRYHSQKMQIQAEESARTLSERGIKIHTYNDLRHRKLAIVDNKILWEGSLNILSQSRSREVMRRSASKTLCRNMDAFTNICH